MSFLTRCTPLTSRVASLSPAARTTIPALAVGAGRSISSTARRDSGPVDAAKDTLKKTDELASKAAVKGIEKGEHARDKVKEVFGQSRGEAEAQAGKVKGEASELAGKGKGKAEEALGEAKGKAKEAAGDLKS